MTRIGVHRGVARKLAALGIGLGLAAALLLVVEAVLFALNRISDDGVTLDEPYLYAFSESLGYTPLPNAEGRAVKTRRGETIFDVTYRTDGLGRRATPAPATPPSEFIAFFGGSFTFGHGLEDHETLPAVLQEQMPDVRAYNYGFSGYGPQQALMKLRSGALPNEMAEANGTMVYVFMEHHVQRAIGSMRVWTQWGRHFPCFALDDNGALEYRGSFVNARPRLSIVYDALKHEQFTRYFDIDIPVLTTVEHLRLSAAILGAARAEFSKLYPGGRFVVLLYPASPGMRFDHGAFAAMLRKRNVDVFDASEILDMSAAEYHIAHDGHPTAAAHRVVAQHLASYLRGNDG